MPVGPTEHLEARLQMARDVPWVNLARNPPANLHGVVGSVQTTTKDCGSLDWVPAPSWVPVMVPMVAIGRQSQYASAGLEWS